MFKQVRLNDAILKFYQRSQPIAFSNAETLYDDLVLLRDQILMYGDLSEAQTNYLNDFIEKFDKKLTSTTQEILSIWLDDGLLADIVREAINDEVIGSRDGESNLNLRLIRDKQDSDTKINLLQEKDDKLTKQLVQTKQVASQDGYEINSNITLSRPPLVTFVSDDADLADYSEQVKSVFINNQVPCVISAIPSRIEANDSNTMTYAQLKELQDLHGYEITSHSLNHTDLRNLTEDEIDYDLRVSKELLNENGLVCKNLCIPYGDYNAKVKKVAQRYYRGVRVSGHRTNPYPIDNLNIYSMTSEFNDDYDFENLDACKFQVDKALANNEWLVFLFHGWAQTPASLDNLRALITYIKSKSIDIVTMDQALDVYANSIQSGTGAQFRLGKDGVIYSKQGAIYYQGQDAVTVTSPIGDYFPNHLNICPIIGEKANFPGGVAGTLLTYNFKSDEVGFQWQEYNTFNTQMKYFRRVTTTGVWTSWEQINYRQDEQIVLTKGRDEYSGLTLPNAFPVGRIIHTVVSPNSSGMPITSSGLFVINTTGLKTSGASDYGMVGQEFTQYGTNNKWVRTAVDGETWTNWQKVSVV